MTMKKKTVSLREVFTTKEYTGAVEEVEEVLAVVSVTLMGCLKISRMVLASRDQVMLVLLPLSAHPPPPPGPLRIRRDWTKMKNTPSGPEGYKASISL